MLCGIFKVVGIYNNGNKEYLHGAEPFLRSR
jgi:hypothetical protein